MENMKKTNWGIVALAAITSAIITLLFAPKSGEETRKELKDKAIDTKQSLQTSKDHLVDDFKQSYFEAAEEVEVEMAYLEKRQRELNETIASIENDLRN